MGSKTFVLLGLLLATLLLITSKVTARDLAEQENNGIEGAKYGGGRCYGPGCYGGGGGGCYGRGCYGGGGCYGRGCYGGGGGWGCRYGCCGYRGYYGGCRCCSYEGEPVDKED